jgi:hypothetical protein
VNVDYEDVPTGYRAIAKYTANASKTVATGYVTTADYTGEIAKAITGDTTYTAYFEGKEINPSPKPTATPEPSDTASPTGNPRGGGHTGLELRCGAYFQHARACRRSQNG